MKQQWYRERLTPSKQRQPLWQELADAVQELVDTKVEPVLARLAGLTSAFAMEPDDLNRRISELGGFFHPGSNVAPEDKPIVLLQRRDDIHLKKTDNPIVNAISREFGGLKVVWSPLYAPLDQIAHPYGSLLMTGREIEQAQHSIDDYFLTSRGVIEVDLEALQLRGYDEFELDGMIRRFIEPLVPLRIVFDGQRLFVHYTLVEAEEVILATLATVSDLAGPESVMTEGADSITHPQNPPADQAPPLDQAGPALLGYVPRLDVMRLDAWSLDRVIG